MVPAEARAGEPIAGEKSERGRRRAAGIYGTVVTAAIIDTAGDHGSTIWLAAQTMPSTLDGVLGRRAVRGTRSASTRRAATRAALAAGA